MLKCYICDDSTEQAILLMQYLKKFIANDKHSISVDILTPAALKTYTFNIEHTNILFMEMILEKGGVNGLTLAENIRKKNQQMYLIFVTKHAELLRYALRGNIIPAGFIMKPVGFADIEEIMHNILNLHDEEQSDYFIINIGSELIRLPYSQILYFEALNKKIHVYTHSRRISYYYSLAALEGELTGLFIRCHNSYIINTKRVNAISFSDMQITMENGVKIPLSRSYKAQIKAEFKV